MVYHTSSLPASTLASRSSTQYTAGLAHRSMTFFQPLTVLYDLHLPFTLRVHSRVVVRSLWLSSFTAAILRTSSRVPLTSLGPPPAHAATASATTGTKAILLSLMALLPPCKGLARPGRAGCLTGARSLVTWPRRAARGA